MSFGIYAIQFYVQSSLPLLCRFLLVSLCYISITKRLYEYGNFTKFIKPGAVRVETELKGKDLNAVSFDVDGGLVTVLVNSADAEKTLTLNAPGYQAAELHLTDSAHNLVQVPVETYVTGGQVKLPAKSVVTLVMDRT